MWVEHIENGDPLLADARRLSAGSDDECFSAAEVARSLGIVVTDALHRLAVLEKSDWIARVGDDHRTPATGDTRWIVREHGSLTVGKCYEVLEIVSDDYRVLDDRDDPVLFHRSCFSVVEASEPVFWSFVSGDEGERYSGPPQWARPGFFEDYFDGVQGVRAEFWSDLRGWYPRTWNERRSSS